MNNPNIDLIKRLTQTTGLSGYEKAIGALVADEPKGFATADLARHNSINVQEAVRKGGGTDAVMLALADRGIPCVVTGVPVRYAHSHNCLISLSDYENLIDLLVSVCVETTDLGSIFG
jgi:putative aminopeptidase FrvX